MFKVRFQSTLSKREWNISLTVAMVSDCKYWAIEKWFKLHCWSIFYHYEKNWTKSLIFVYKQLEYAYFLFANNLIGWIDYNILPTYEKL